MGTRIAAAAVAAAALAMFSVTACSSGDDGKGAAATPSPSASVTLASPSSPASTDGTGPEVNAMARQTYLAALAAIDPALAANPDQALAVGRAQCARITADPETADHLAAQEFGDSGHPLTDAQGAAIDTSLKLTVCKRN